MTREILSDKEIRSLQAAHLNTVTKDRDVLIASVIAAGRAIVNAVVEKLGPPGCPECQGTAERDSGGSQPWGEAIMLSCDHYPHMRSALVELGYPDIDRNGSCAEKSPEPILGYRHTIHMERGQGRSELSPLADATLVLGHPGKDYDASYSVTTQALVAGVSPAWRPIATAPKDNKRLLYLARFDSDGKLLELTFDGSWEYWQESWEMPHINGYDWKSDSGIEEPSHWAYQDEPLPPVSAADKPENNQ